MQSMQQQFNKDGHEHDGQPPSRTHSSMCARQHAQSCLAGRVRVRPRSRWHGGQVRLLPAVHLAGHACWPGLGLVCRCMSSVCVPVLLGLKVPAEKFASNSTPLAYVAYEVCWAACRGVENSL